MNKPTWSPSSSATAPKAEKNEFGFLPEWNLDDLYPGMDSKKFKRDFDKAIPDAKAFEEKYKGRLADGLSDGGAQLATAISAYEI